MCIGEEVCKFTEKSNNNKILTEFPVKKIQVNSKKEDLLARVTCYIKEFLIKLSCMLKVFQTWKYYRMIHGKTQPAHVLVILLVLLIGSITQWNVDRDSGQPPTSSVFIKIIYLGCFAIHFGAQIWMTFVSGLALYFTLPRHTFSSVQKILFPKYFSLNSILSFTTLFAFLKCETSRNSYSQVTYLFVCLSVELLIRLYLTPTLIKLIVAKNLLEEKAGIGSEIGEYLPGYLMECQEYGLLHGNFRKLHMIIAVGNMITMACSMTHLYYLASRICV